MNTLTQKEVRIRLRKISPTIEILGRYVGCFQPLRCRCRTCGKVWFPRWSTLSQGEGCPICGRMRQYAGLRLSLKNIKSRLKKITPSIRIRGAYKNAMAPLSCRCTICWHAWNSTWASLSRGVGCPKCGGSLRLTTSDVRERIRHIHPNIVILGEYKNNKSPLKCKCSSCNYAWYPRWNDLSNGHGCPGCNTSVFEKEVRKVAERITGKKFSKVRLKCLRGRSRTAGLELDCYNKKLDLAIEAQGVQHYKPIDHWGGKKSLEYIRLNDLRKRKLCRYHGIKLIVVPYNVKDIKVHLHAKLKGLL